MTNEVTSTKLQVEALPLRSVRSLAGYRGGVVACLTNIYRHISRNRKREPCKILPAHPRSAWLFPLSHLLGSFSYLMPYHRSVSRYSAGGAAAALQYSILRFSWLLNKCLVFRASNISAFAFTSLSRVESWLERMGFSFLIQSLCVLFSNCLKTYI